VAWGIAYALDPGFAFGVDTVVAPSGVRLGGLPAVPLLAALPEPGPAPSISFVALAAPLLAGAVAGVLTIRVQQAPSQRMAALWGLTSGVSTGLVVGAFAGLSAGPTGGGRLVLVGPSFWQVGLAGALEVGAFAALAAWLAGRRSIPMPPVRRW